MSAFKVRKFRDPEALERFLHGGVQGGASLLGGVPGLEGKTLIFNKPVVETVTFIAGTVPGKHTVAEIIDQIEAGTTGVVAGVLGPDANLTLVEGSPSAGVTIDTAGTANALLGFSSDADTAGTAYPPSATYVAPCYVAFTHDAPSNSLILLTWE
jgi:hypothetical protein